MRSAHYLNVFRSSADETRVQLTPVIIRDGQRHGRDFRHGQRQTTGPEGKSSTVAGMQPASDVRVEMEPSTVYDGLRIQGACRRTHLGDGLAPPLQSLGLGGSARDGSSFLPE
jgi:hypothetical protein